jgi:release factor glutamine methyltransferase
MTQPAGAERVWTIGALLRWTEQFLSQKGFESPRLDAEVLLAHALGCRRIELYTRSEEVAADEVRAKFRDIVKRRVEGCPVAYLVGTKEFYLLPFEVTPAVLIPRPATEALVLAALDRAKPLSAPRVLDIGTGSGCLAVSVAKRHAGASVVAVDTSAEALDVARGNAERHGVSERVAFRRSDLFDGIAGELPFDLILSNPPYIPSADIATLAPDVRGHEPRAALDGGPDGLAVFTRLVAKAPAFLNPGGWLLVEIGAGQEAVALRRLATVSGLTAGPTVRDGDGHARVVVARRSTA